MVNNISVLLKLADLRLFSCARIKTINFHKWEGGGEKNARASREIKRGVEHTHISVME